MEYLFPHLDEFILDFDAEEASLLHAHVLSAGQVQAGIFAGPGLGSYPVRRVHNLPNASLKTRGRQQPQVGGGGGPPAEPVQLDSQLDALRREIARLEQQKQKQGTVRAVSSGSAAVGNIGVRRAQKVANATTLSKPTGTASAGAAAPQCGPAAAQRDPAMKRSRLAPGPAQAGAAPASGAGATDLPRPGTAGNPAAVRGLTQPAASGATPASSEQSPAATGSTAVPAQQRVGSKRPADDGTGGAAAQQHRALPKRQPPQQRPQQLEQPPVELQVPEASELGPDIASVRQAQPAGPRADGPPLQHASQAAAARLSSGEQGGHRLCDGSEQEAGGTCAPAGAVQQRQGQQGPGTSSAPERQQVPSSQAGPGPPRKRPRIPGQRPAASTSGPAAVASGSPGSQQAAAVGVATAQTASNSSASTQDGSPAAMLGPGKRARPRVGGPGACPPGLGAAAGVDEGAAGSGDEGLGASDRREPAGPAHGRPAASDTGAAHISPEAELAATAFLASFMTQISGEGQDRDRGTATAGVQQQQRQNAGAAAAPPAAAQANGGVQTQKQAQQQQRLPQRNIRGGNPAPSTRAAGLAPEVARGLQGGPDNGCTQGGPLAVGGRGAVSPGSGGGALARRAAAERTSAAVQRLRRKSSGVAGPDPLLRPVTSTGATGAAARAISADAATGAAAAGVVAAGGVSSARASARSPAVAGGLQDLVPSAAAGCRQPERNFNNASVPCPARCAQQPAVGTHPQPVAAPGGVAAGVGDCAPAASTVGESPGRTLGAAGLNVDVAPAAWPHAPGAAATELVAAEADTQDLFGAVSSPVAAPLSGGVDQEGGGSPGAAGAGEAALGLGGSSQAGTAANMPPWVQVHAGGWSADRARSRPGVAPGDASQQREQPPQPPSLERLGFGPQGHPMGAAAELTSGGFPDAVALHASGLATGPGLGPASAVAAAAAALAPAGAPPTGFSQPQPANAPHPPGAPSAMLFRAGGPFGMLSPMGLPQLPFPQPPLGLPPHMLLGAPFPGAFPPGPPPGMQWRPGPPGGVPLGAGQPVVSLVEVDVIARKELILLKWHMLQEIASELETDWVEACHAHNRLRHLSMAQAQPGRPTAPPPAGDPMHNGDAAAYQAVVPRRAEDVPSVSYLHPTPHEHPPPHALGGQHAYLQPEQQPQLHPPPQQMMQLQQQSQPRQQEQQQHGPGAAASLQQAAAFQPLLAHLSAPRPHATQDEGGVRFATEAHTATRTNGLQSAQEASGLQGLEASYAVRPSNPGHLVETRPQQQQYSGRKRQAADVPPPEHDAGPEREPGSQREQQTIEASVLTVRHGPPAQYQQEAAASGAAVEAPREAGGGTACGLESRGGPQRRSGDGAAGLPPPRQLALGPAAPVRQTERATAAEAALGATGEGAAGAAGVRTREADGRQPENGAVEWRTGDSARGPASAGADRSEGDNLSLHSGHSDAAAAAQQLHVQPAARADAGHDGVTATRWAVGGGDQVAAVSAPSAAERQAAATAPREGAAAEEASIPGAAPHPSHPQPGVSDGGRGRGGSGVGLGSAGDDGSRPSTRQQQAHVWMPWEDTSAQDEGLGAHAGVAEAQSNGVALGSQAATGTLSGGGDGGGATSSGPASAGWGDGGEGDSGHGVGAAPFTGLSFKLAMAPVAGRRVAAMRARSGTLQASPVKAAALGAVPKRVAPSVSAVVAAAIVRPGRHGSPAVAMGAATPGAAAPAAVAAAPSAAAAAVAAPAELPLRVQSAPQVPPATRARGGSRSPGDAAAASGQPQEQQAPQAVVSSSSGSAGVREVAAAVAHPATQTAPHVQAPPAARGAAAPTDNAGFPHPARHSTQQSQHALPPQPGQDQQQQQPAQQSLCEASMTLQQQEQQQQPAALPQLASPQAPSPPLLYQARRDFMLTAQGAAAAPGLPATLVEVLSSRYTSPLSIFRSYSVGSPR